MNAVKKVLVVGASGGSGIKTVDALVELGCQVTALSRKASRVFDHHRVSTIDGSALDKKVLTRAVSGQDAVIVILGISENHIRTRLLGPKNTPINIRSQGTKTVIEVMKEQKVKRLLVQTTYGSGPSRNKLRPVDQLLFNILLKPQIDDTEKQDQIVRESGLQWTITQPVHLVDTDKHGHTSYTSENSEVGEWAVSRDLVGRVNAACVLDSEVQGKTIAISSAA